MKIIILYIYILLFLNSCNSQNATTLNFFNKTDVVIDSITIFSENEIYKIGSIKKDSTFKIDINNIEFKTNSEGENLFKVYFKKNILGSGWGFHYDKQLKVNNETFYINNNGIRRKDVKVEKPKVATLFFYNDSDKLIDSIYSNNNSILKIIQRNESKVNIEYDFDKFLKDPEFNIILSGKNYRIKIDDYKLNNYDKPFYFLIFKNNELRDNDNNYK